MKALITPRQKEIVELLVQGYNDKQVALMFGIAHQTVRNEVRDLMERTDTHSRIHTLAELIRKGLIML